MDGLFIIAIAVLILLGMKAAYDLGRLDAWDETLEMLDEALTEIQKQEETFR